MFTKADIEKYFLAEKNAALFFIVLGLVAVVVSLLFFFILKTNWYKGFAIPLLVIGLIQGFVGCRVYKTADEYRKDNVFAYDLNPSKLENKEWPRMQKVEKQLNRLLLAEALIFIASVVLFFYFKNNSGAALWRGLALGLMLQAILSLGFDWFAKQRAKTYLSGLHNFIEQKP